MGIKLKDTNTDMLTSPQGKSNRKPASSEAGLSTFATIGAFVGLGVVFLTIFMVSLSGSGPKPTDTTAGTGQTDQSQSDTSTSGTAQTAAKEPPFIRLPENSTTYANTAYNFRFGYPDSFGKLQEFSTPSSIVIFRAESAMAAQKPIGSGKAVLNGKFGAYVYKKSDFKIVIQLPDTAVTPAKTGNDTTWKVVDKGTAGNLSVGDAYPVKSTKSQTGIPVFDFGLKNGESLLSRWVFESGDHYILIAMPTITKTDGSALTSNDLAAYNVIGNNLARTVRVPPKASADTPSTTPAPSTGN